MLDPDDPASIARVREQTATLVEADRVCRDALGIGVAELIRMLDPSGVEDQRRAAPSEAVSYSGSIVAVVDLNTGVPDAGSAMRGISTFASG